MLDGESGRILEANQAALNLYGYSREELVKKNINELSAEVEKTRGSLKNSAGRVPLRWHYKKDGTIFPVELALTMHSQNGRSIIISTARDITERIESEEALRISENNFRNSLESSPLGIGIVDENWIFIYANPSLLKLWGYATAEELSMVPLNRRFTAEGYRLYLERHNKREKGECLPETFEQEILSKKGDIRIVEIRISSVFWNNQSRLMGIYSDITEKKQSKELLTLLAERSPIGVYIAQDGKFKYVNIPLRQYLGYSTEDLKNTRTLDYVFHDDRKMVQFNVIKMLKKNIMFPYEYRIICKDNQIKWVIETVVRVVYQGQQAILGSMIDITPIKKLEKKVVEFEELNKLKTDILSTVSHELRTPLTTIKGYASMLIQYNRKISTEERLQSLHSIDRSADHLTGLVNQLLDLSRMDAGLLKLYKKRTNIGALITMVVSDAGLRSKDHIIVSDLPPRIPRLDVDPNRIRQVLDNLIDNAIEYSLHGKKIIVGAKKDKETNELIISVSDQGIGIDDSEIPKIFQRMYRIENRIMAKQSKKGLGLGLAICKALVEGHMGRIWVESEIGKGSIFYFSLPLFEAEKAEKQFLI